MKESIILIRRDFFISLNKRKLKLNRKSYFCKRKYYNETESFKGSIIIKQKFLIL